MSTSFLFICVCMGGILSSQGSIRILISSIWKKMEYIPWLDKMVGEGVCLFKANILKIRSILKTMSALSGRRHILKNILIKTRWWP